MHWSPKVSNSEQPRYKAIAFAIANAIETRELHPGERLPTHRELAKKLNVSVQTVSRAYAEAKRSSFVSCEVGRGTFVRTTRPSPEAPLSEIPTRTDMVDFSGATPLASSEQVEALRSTLSGIANSVDLSMLREDQPSNGSYFQREAAVQWLGENGVTVSPQETVLFDGLPQALWAALSVLADPGDVVATESLTSNDLIRTTSMLKLNLRGLPLDDEGVDPDALEQLCKTANVKVLCLTPTYSNPMVALMGEKRRRKLVEISRMYDVAILETDPYRPLMSKPPRVMQSMAPERVWYVTNFSSTIMTWLSTTFLVCPADAISRLLPRLPALGRRLSPGADDVTSHWIYDGTIEKLVRQHKLKLAARHRIFEELMRDYRYRGYQDCMHVWLNLPEQWRSSRFVRDALSHGLIVTPPDPFIVGRAVEPHAVQISIGNFLLADDVFRRGVERLSQLLAEEPELLAVGY